MNIIFQDKWIIVCEKPVGLLSESGGMPELLAEASGSKSIYCVHRLDKAVGGLMVYAKTADAAAKLSALIAEKAMHKQYLAVVEGVPSPEKGMMQDLLFKDSGRNKSYVVKRMRKGVKEARLEYETLKSLGGTSLVSIRLITGRSHQIRVQFSSRRLPLVGDTRYGGRCSEGNIALFSQGLRFPHPITGTEMVFSALPQNGIWEQYTDYIKGD